MLFYAKILVHNCKLAIYCSYIVVNCFYFCYTKMDYDILDYYGEKYAKKICKKSLFSTIFNCNADIKRNSAYWLSKYG